MYLMALFVARRSNKTWQLKKKKHFVLFEDYSDNWIYTNMTETMIDIKLPPSFSSWKIKHIITQIEIVPWHNLYIIPVYNPGAV